MSVLEVPPLTVADLRRRIDALPRFHLTDLPTPLQEMPNLRKTLGGPRVLIKRDDLTHSALGGNKNRKFEFEIAEALHLGCDVVVWGGGVRQSNHARQCAAAARKAALDIVLVLNRGVHGDVALCLARSCASHEADALRSTVGPLQLYGLLLFTVKTGLRVTF